MAANYGPATDNDPRMRTADGHEITDGMVVWDYDLKVCTVDVDRSNVTSPYWDGWFTTRRGEGNGSLMNGERLCVRHPFTGKRADES